MTSPAERDQLFKTFGRAFFKRDVGLLYEAVTADFTWLSSDARGRVERIQGREAVGAKLAAPGPLEGVRFHDVAYHHAPDATFMTFRLTGTERATGMSVEEVGIERYTFRDGRIAVKDVYRKPTAPGG